MADNFFNIPGMNSLPYNPQMPNLAQISQGPNVQAPGYINPQEKSGTPNFTMQPSWQFGLNYNQIAFSSAVQGIGAFLRGNNQKKDFASYNKAQQNPLSQLPENPNNTDQALYGMKQYAEGGRFDDFDDFNEDDFEDLKSELDSYFKGDKNKSEEQPEKEEQEPEKVNQPEQEDQEEPESHSAMDFLLQQQPEEPAESPEHDANILAQLSGQKEIPHPAVYAGKPTDNVEAFKRGIAQVESAGYQEGNKNSSAYGKYQFTAPTREAVREQFFKDISKGDFENAYKSDPKFQERVMDVYGSHLLSKYSDPHQAATAFFLGEGKASMYNQRDYNPGHGNVSVGKYLDTFDKGYGKRQGGHIMNAPGSVSTDFDRPYNFKMEEGGDPTQVRKPIQTSDPNDPRIKKYQDSLRNYNWTNKQISGLTKEGWDRNKSIYIEEQAKAYGEPQDPKGATPSSYSVFKKKNNYGVDDIGYIGNYAMPVQPYQYVAPQNVQQTPGKSTQQSATKSTIYTSNPDDPRLKAYQDSLNNYNWSNSNGRNKGFNTLFPDDAAKLKSQSDYKNWSFTNNNTKEQPQYYVYDAAGKPEGNGAGATRDYYAQYSDPQQPYAYKKPIPELKRSQVQGPQSATPGIGQIGAPTGGPGPLAGGPTNFSFTGRNDQGQQDTRYFSDLDTWKAATDQMGYRWRNETNNGKNATASGYQFKEGGEYHLTNDQIKQLKKQGYQIEIIK